MQRSTLKLIARKSHKYGTRHFVAGEEYELPTEHAIAEVALRNADFAKPKKPEPKPQPEPLKIAEPEMDELSTMRKEAESLGIEVDGRWGRVRLSYEIAQAKAER